MPRRIGTPEVPLKDTNFQRLWTEEERLKQTAMVQAALASPTAYTDESGATGKADDMAEAKSDWEQLRLTAAVIFPSEMALRFNMSPRQRLAAIAHCLGWKPAKIMAAGKISKATLYAWLKREEFIEFCKAFDYHRGSKDSKELVDKEQYNALCVLRELMGDTKVSSSTRKDIAQWFYEQKHGKPKETREIQGTDVRKLTEQLMRAKGAQIQPEELLGPLTGPSDSPCDPAPTHVIPEDQN